MKIIKLLALALLVSLTSEASAKVRILTFHYNEPRFLEIQDKTLKAFLKDDYELIVFNDGNTPEREQNIRKTCENLGVRCIRFQQEWHATSPVNKEILDQLTDPSFIHSHIGITPPFSIEGVGRQISVRHSHVIQYALDNFGYNHNDIVVILDGDAFPIREMSIRDFLENESIVGIERRHSEENVSFLWVPFIAIDMPKIQNKTDLKFRSALINGKLHDTGSYSYHFLRNNPDVPFRQYLGTASSGVAHWQTENLLHYGFNLAEAELIHKLPRHLMLEFHMNNCIMHFAGSSFGLEGWQTKLQCVQEFVEKITK
jgi:hypothetical protein